MFIHLYLSIRSEIKLVQVKPDTQPQSNAQFMQFSPRPLSVWQILSPQSGGT